MRLPMGRYARVDPLNPNLCRLREASQTRHASGEFQADHLDSVAWGEARECPLTSVDQIRGLTTPRRGPAGDAPVSRNSNRYLDV